MKKLLIFLSIVFLWIGCSSPVSYEYEGKDFLDRYIVCGYVLKNSLPVYGKTVIMYIRDYKYQTWQTTFECTTSIEGKYRFTVTYEPWNLYYYDLSVDYNKVTDKIEFGQIDRIDFNL